MMRRVNPDFGTRVSASANGRLELRKIADKRTPWIVFDPVEQQRIYFSETKSKAESMLARLAREERYRTDAERAHAADVRARAERMQEGAREHARQVAAGEVVRGPVIAGVQMWEKRNPKKYARSVAKARKRIRNGVIKVPASWLEATWAAFKGGGGHVVLPVSAFPYPSWREVLTKLYPHGVGVDVEVTDERDMGSLIEPIDAGQDFGVALSSDLPDPRETAEHELRHMIQRLGSMAQGREFGDSAFGLPSKRATRALDAGAALTTRDLKARGLRGHKGPERREMHRYFHDAKEWQPWVGTVARGIVRKLAATSLPSQDEERAAIMQVTTMPFYRGTAPDTRRELLKQVYTEVQRLRALPEAARANPKRKNPATQVPLHVPSRVIRSPSAHGYAFIGKQLGATLVRDLAYWSAGAGATAKLWPVLKAAGQPHKLPASEVPMGDFRAVEIVYENFVRPHLHPSAEGFVRGELRHYFNLGN